MTELQVVIGVLLVLAALIFPALSGAKKKAQEAQCANNLRQLGIAMENFVSINHGYPFRSALHSPPFREGLRSAPADFPNADWEDALGAYASGFVWNTNRHPWQSSGLFHCPSARPPSCPTWPEHICYADYGYNAYGLSSYFDSRGSLGLSPILEWTNEDNGIFDMSPLDVQQPVRESQIVMPSDMMAIGDGFRGNSQIVEDGSNQLWRGKGYGIREIASSTRRAYSRHSARAEVVFCDGHVMAQTLTSLFKDDGDGALGRWNRDHQPHRERLAH
ncbi:MAG: H-X9-DG-CTERM domain-containing protein [Limisphaerales bacterium]